MWLVNIILLLTLVLLPVYELVKVQYLGIERPVVLSTNPKYFANVTVSSRRIDRNNPIRYFNLTGEIKFNLHRNVLVHLIFYELLTNVYKPSFVELHFDGCSLFDNPIFGRAIRRAVPVTCPVPPGFYSFANVTIPPSKVPKNFPFTKGRMYLNVTLVKTNESIGVGYADVELKTVDKDRKDLFVD